jgi:hypothetical protein
LDDIFRFLKPFALWTKFFESETEITISHVIPVVTLLKKVIEDASLNIMHFVKEIKKDFDERWRVFKDVYYFAMLLDPRFSKSKILKKKDKKKYKKLLEEEYKKLKKKEKNDENKIEYDSLDILIYGERVEQNELSKFYKEYLDKDINLLNWWRNNQIKYPILSILARKYLSIPSSTSAIERDFSSCGFIMTNKRTHLAEDIFSSLVFLRDYHYLEQKN